MGNRTRQKNKRGNSKVESNDSPEIPDKGETSDIPGLPSGVGEMQMIQEAERTEMARTRLTWCRWSNVVRGIEAAQSIGEMQMIQEVHT